MKTRLQKWCDREGYGAKARLARELGTSYALVDRYVRGATVPTLRRALEIERATGGYVTAKDLAKRVSD